MEDSRLVAITVLKDEEDIVGETLRHSARILDLVVVIDCGSSDSTPKQVEAVSREYPHVVLAQHLPPTLPELVRPEVWRLLRGQMPARDWWLLVDGDEFLDEDARAKCTRAAAAGADHLFSAHANFYYKRSEAQAWRDGIESLADRQRPIAERRRCYRMHSSMPRAFRNQRWMRFTSASAIPELLVKPARETLLFRHYQYRDVEQLAVRIRNRAGVAPDSDLARDNPHWLISSVEGLLSPDDDPHLRLAEPGEPLVADPELPPVPHPSPLKVLAKRVRAMLHGYARPIDATSSLLSFDPASILARAR